MSDALRGKVAFYLPSLAGGGAERVMVALANSMAARGWAVELVLAQATGPYLGEVDPSVRLVDLNAGRVLNSLGRFTRYLRQQAPTVVISTMAHANIIAIVSLLLRMVLRAICRALPACEKSRSG